MTGLSERDGLRPPRHVIELVSEAMAAGARQDRACAAISLSARTMQRWQCDVLRGGPGARGNQRPLRVQAPQNKLSALERQRLLAIANSAEFGHLPPSQIVLRLADRGQYVACESTFNRILKAEHQLRHRGVALGQPPERPGQPRSKPRALSASAPNELFSWDITYLPTSVKGRYF